MVPKNGNRKGNGQKEWLIMVYMAGFVLQGNGNETPYPVLR